MVQQNLNTQVIVTRAAPNTDATLINLSLLGGELTPEFSSIIYDYTVTVNRADEVGILENPLAKIGIYPNPTTGELRIESGVLRVEVIEIFDISGKKQKIESRKQKAKGKILIVKTVERKKHTN